MGKITIHDIAKKLNTTAATVSRALNDNKSISIKMKEKVAIAAKEMGYERNVLASNLRKGKTNIIGVIVPYADRSLFASVIRSLEEKVQEHGMNIMISQSHDSYEKELRCVETLLQAQVSTIVMSHSKGDNPKDHLKRIIDGGTSLILFDRPVEEIKTHSVTVNDYDGAYKAVTHLIEMGYQRIAHFIMDKNTPLYKERYRGYKRALKDNNLVLDPSLVIEVATKIADGAVAAEALMQLEQTPDAIFSSSDFAALGAMNYLIEKGIEVPSEFGIIGFSNEPFTNYVTPSLSTIDQKTKLMGETIAHFILNKKDNKAEIKQFQSVSLTPQLLIRNSSNRKQNLKE